MAAGAQADHIGARCEGSGHSDGRILDDDAFANLDAERVGGMQIEVGSRLAAIHMFGAAEDPAFEMVCEAEMVQVPPNPCLLYTSPSPTRP